MAEEILAGRLPERNCKRKPEKEHLLGNGAVFAITGKTRKDFIAQ